MKLSQITSSKFGHLGAALFYIGLALWVTSPFWAIFRDKSQVPQTSSGFLGVCKYKVLQDIESPDKGKVATLGVSDCGASTGWQTDVSMFNRVQDKTLSGLLLLQGQADGYSMAWENSYALVALVFAIEDVLALRKQDFAGAKVVLRPKAIVDKAYQCDEAR